MEKRSLIPAPIFPRIGMASWICLLVCLMTACSPSHSPDSPIRVGGKNFTEQLILSELTACHLEQRGFTVTRHPGFGGTPLVHQALLHHDIDLYIEYSGTAWQVNLGESPGTLEQLRSRYLERFNLEILAPLGFQNGYAFVGRRGTVPDRLDALAPLAPRLSAGFNAEFLGRPDGWPRIQKAYGLNFKKISNLDVGLIYRALDSGTVDLVCGFSTDARLTSGSYQVIHDNLGIFPRYEAVPIVRRETLAKHPGLRGALLALEGRLDEKTMRELNRQAEKDGRPIPEIARTWLQQHPLPMSP